MLNKTSILLDPDSDHEITLQLPSGKSIVIRLGIGETHKSADGTISNGGLHGIGITLPQKLETITWGDAHMNPSRKTSTEHERKIKELFAYYNWNK